MDELAVIHQLRPKGTAGFLAGCLADFQSAMSKIAKLPAFASVTRRRVLKRHDFNGAANSC